MPFFRLDVALTLVGPVLSKSTGPGLPGVDAPFARDPEGRLALPGSLIQGHLRQAWAELGFSPSDIGAWLGEANDDGQFEPRRALLNVSPFFTAEGSDGIRFRISVDDLSGSAGERMLQAIEAPFRAGEPATFSGTIHLSSPKEAASRLVDHIVTGLQWLPAVGALTGVGFGRVDHVSVSSREIPPAAIKPRGQTRVGVRLRFDRPICIGSPTADRRLFKSADVMPGGVLKGALANQWNNESGSATAGAARFSDASLTRRFHELRFSHAMPVLAGVHTRPTVAPLSLATADVHIVDLALCEGPVLAKPTEKPRMAPAFAPDWKEADLARIDALVEACRPRRRLDVRHAHDFDARRARDEQLYAYETVIPRAASSGGDRPVEWYFEIAVPEDLEGGAALVDAVLSSLRWGLHDVGKTRACADVEVLEVPLEPTDSLASQFATTESWIVTLQTPALMFIAEELTEASTSTDLFSLYARAWSDISGGAVTLIRHFSRQSLAGGRYIKGRFGTGRTYHPYALTDAGSVFVLQASEGMAQRAAELFARLARTGVPIPTTTAEVYGAVGNDAWRRCPYVPENGFGEIRVNMPLHVDRGSEAARWIGVLTLEPIQSFAIV